ncbi:MAG: NADP-dependent succinic semialdehyde dehydrogenase [Acidimicrobiales bacterium]
MGIATVNPTSEETLERWDPLSDAEIEARIGRASDAFASYRLTTFADRSRWLVTAAGILESEVDDVARMMTTEMGKTLAAARAETMKCAAACRFYAAHAEAFLGDEPVGGAGVGARRAFARYQPLGPVLAVMPWNFPLWQAMRFAAPALMAGNVGLLKHASNVPRTALFMETLFHRAGFPDAVFQTLLIGSEQVERVLRDPEVKAATLTGSTPAGRSVGSTAGAELKPSVLELGGSDAFIVMPSADLERASGVAVTARCQNNGQSCIAAKRFIVHDAVAGEFERRFVDGMRALRVGDPLDERTDVGPLATDQGRRGVEELVSDAVAKGASVLCGGTRPRRRGWFFPPTVVTGVTPQMRMFSEEVFGPVASVFRVPDIDHAIELANATGFGLGSNAWTEDRAEQDRFVRDLEAGAVFINGMTTSYPELPFGGVKQSGYGRELSAHGIREFCNLKTVWVGQAGHRTDLARSE